MARIGTRNDDEHKDGSIGNDPGKRRRVGYKLTLVGGRVGAQEVHVLVTLLDQKMTMTHTREMRISTWIHQGHKGGDKESSHVSSLLRVLMLLFCCQAIDRLNDMIDSNIPRNPRPRCPGPWRRRREGGGSYDGRKGKGR